MSDFVETPKMFSKESEEMVLAGIMLYNDEYHDISRSLNKSHFYLLAHQEVWEAIGKIIIDGKEADPITVGHAVEGSDVIDDGILFCQQMIPTGFFIQGIDQHAEIIREYATRRVLANSARELGKAAVDNSVSIESIKTMAQATALDLVEDEAQDVVVDAGALALEITEHIEKIAGGEVEQGAIGSGYPEIDEMTGGYRKASLDIYAARPGMGKTAFLTGSMIKAAVAGARPHIFSLEMSRRKIVQRMLSQISAIPVKKIESAGMTDEEWARYYKAVKILNNIKITIDDTPGLNIAQVRSRATASAIKNGTDIIGLDYIQMMNAIKPLPSRVYEIEQISRGLKEMAKMLDVPVIALAQLSRGVENRQDKRPLLSDLRDSGSLEQDADLVAFLYRDEYYNPDTTEFPDQCELLIRKNREGALGTVRLHWSGETTTFSSLNLTSAMTGASI